MSQKMSVGKIVQAALQANKRRTGKVILQGISKRGDTFLRTLLVHGARSVLAHAKTPGPWLDGIQARRPANVVCVAQAAKIARTIWAITAKEQEYQGGYKSVRPQAA